MKKTLILLSVLTVIFTASVQAQTTSAAKNQVIKPEFIVSDVFFAYNVLNSIDINGREVEPFIECRNHLKTLAEKAQADKKQPTDKIVDEMPLLIAQNLTQFLSRSTFKGEQADIFKRFVDALIAAAEKLPK